MREGLPRASADRGAKRVEQEEVEDAKPRGAHLRVHGEHDAQAVLHTNKPSKNEQKVCQIEQ